MMSNYSSRTRGQLIVTSQWSEFFADLTRSHQERPVAIEKGRSLPVGDAPKEWAPFQGVEYHADRKEKTVVFTTGRGPETATHTVEDPSLVWRAHDEHGDLIIVKITDSQSRIVFLLFDKAS